MRAEILTIGDELCRGEIVDTNSSWLADQLWQLGVPVAWMTSCRDDAADMTRAFRDATGRAELVFVSGGLGPTEDDLTVDVLAAVMGVAIASHEPSLARMKERFERARFALTPNNLRQVRVPAGAEVALNPAGIAPGFEVELGRARVFVMPGVPREMQAIFTQAFVPRVRALVATAEKIARRVYRVFGKGESHLDHTLMGIVSGTSETIHYQVLFPETLVKLVVRHADAAAAEARLAELDAELRRRLGELVYGTGDETMPIVVGRALQARQATLAVAESCTGGMLGALITEVPGSSAWFAGGWITYSNELKQKLGVREETLRAHGAVSRATVEEMAAVARVQAGTTHAIAVSGIAGPGGGTPDKPVGTVHVAVAGPDGGLAHKTFVYPGARDQVRRLGAYWGMATLLGVLA